MVIFGAQDASGASFFHGIYDVFCTCLNFSPQKKATSKIIKKSLKITNFLAVFSFFGLPPLAPNRPLPRAVFAMFYAHRALFNKEPFFCLGGGSAAVASLPIAKAKATPHAMRSNMPGIRPVAADPGKFPGEGASNPKKTHWRRLKVTKTNRI